MQIDDLRDYLDILEEYQEVQRISAEVDWNLEMGAITRRVYDLGAPAALFEKIKGYPKGFRALGAPLGTSSRPGHGQFARTALAMHMPPSSTAKEIMSTYLQRKEKLIPPVTVKTGPCKENIDIGDAVDVLKFPIPLIHDGDGGRYIGTWHTVITKDPESSWVNWGMYRLMVHDRNTLGCLFPMQQHIGQMYQKYEAMNKPMPVAVAIGGQPVIPLVSCVMLPPYVNEADVAGALQNAPIAMVKCETVDLEVPASSEIVIEGEVLPHERRTEGPFGEYMGYEAGKSSPKPILRIKAITYRNNPILPFSNMGMPVHEGQTATALIKGAEIYAELKKLGLPVKSVFCPPFGVGHMCVVSTEVPFINFAQRVAHAVWATKPGLFVYYMVIVEAGCRSHQYGRGAARDHDQVPSGQRRPSCAAYSRFPGALAVLSAKGAIDWRRRGSHFRLHLAQGLAQGEHSGKSHLRESLAQGYPGARAQKLGIIRICRRAR